MGRIIDNVGKFIGNEFYTWDSEGFDKTKTAWVAAIPGQVIDNIGEFIGEELYTLDSTSLDKTRTYEVLKRAASSIFVDTDYFGYYSDLVKGKDPVDVVHDVVSVGTEAVVDVFVGARAAKFFGWLGSKLDVPVPIPSLGRTNRAEVLDSSLDVGRGVSIRVANTVVNTAWVPKQQFDAVGLSPEQVKIATTKSIRRNLGLRTNSQGQLLANADQTERLLHVLTNWRRSVYAKGDDFLALDSNLQGTIIHSSVSNRMRQLNIAGVNVNQRLYGSSSYISPATGLPYEYRIPDYHHTIDNVIFDVKPAGTPLSGAQFNDFRSFANTNDVRWIYYEGFR